MTARARRLLLVLYALVASALFWAGLNFVFPFYNIQGTFGDVRELIVERVPFHFVNPYWFHGKDIEILLRWQSWEMRVRLLLVIATLALLMPLCRYHKYSWKDYALLSATTVILLSMEVGAILFLRSL